MAEFQHSVQRRSSHIRFVDEGTHDRELSVVLSKDGDFTNGELRLIEHDGGLRQRSVRFTSCAEAVEGLALITAVSLDPQALLQAASPAEPAPKPTPPPKAVPAQTAPPPKLAPADVLPPPAPPELAARAPGVKLGIGGEFSAAFGALPATAPGGTLFVDLGSGSRAWFAPLVRGAVSHWERRGLSESQGEASFALTLASLSACPVRAGGSVLVLRPCLFASGGALRAWSVNTPDTRAHTRPFWSWGGSALSFVRVSQALDIVADVGLGLAVIRDRFAIGQNPSFWTTGLYLSSNIGLRFVFR